MAACSEPRVGERRVWGGCGAMSALSVNSGVLMLNITIIIKAMSISYA